MIDAEHSLGVPYVPIQILYTAEFAQGGVSREANSKHCTSTEKNTKQNGA